jgi:hypothetical protein
METKGELMTAYYINRETGELAIVNERTSDEISSIILTTQDVYGKLVWKQLDTAWFVLIKKSINFYGEKEN